MGNRTVTAVAVYTEAGDTRQQTQAAEIRSLEALEANQQCTKAVVIARSSATSIWPDLVVWTNLNIWLRLRHGGTAISVVWWLWRHANAATGPADARHAAEEAVLEHQQINTEGHHSSCPDRYLRPSSEPKTAEIAVNRVWKWDVFRSGLRDAIRNSVKSGFCACFRAG